MRDQRFERLRESLEPTVRMVRQLAIDWDEALRLFGEMLAADTGTEPAEEVES
jgi:hypothetical protein